MPVQDQLAIIFEAIAQNIYIPVEEATTMATDVATSTSLSVQGATTSVSLGNGVATEISQVVVDSTATEVSTAGVGLLAMDVGTVGLAIAPALGIIAGVGLYSLAPDFWTNVSNRLVEAGQTVGGKVRAFLNGETKQAGFSKETIEIFKEAFMEAGLFEGTTEVTEEDFPTSYVPLSDVTTSQFNITGGEEYFIRSINANFPDAIPYASQIYNAILNRALSLGNPVKGSLSFIDIKIPRRTFDSQQVSCRIGTNTPENFKITTGTQNSIIYNLSENQTCATKGFFYEFRNTLPSGWEWIVEGICAWQSNITDYGLTENNNSFMYFNYNTSNAIVFPSYANLYDLPLDYPTTRIFLYNIGEYINPNTQSGATLPSENPFPTTYPTWTPWTLPEGLPEIYPIELPVVNPDVTQETAQTPDELPSNDDLLEWLIDNFPQPDPIINPEPSPTPEPDPDPQPEPEPIPEPEPEPTDPNPIDPNPTPTPSPLPIIPDLPDTVESNAMFTVYKPSMTQVNSFGGWLWSSSIVEAIKRIWQNPLDGIISFMKVYADAPTSGSDTIKVGMLDSEVSSPVVSGQFVTVECGSLNVSEKFYNATDYSPFVSMHLYLPFIGIVELDIDEFMSGEIAVTYHVDVYTGTCLAEVKSRRSEDMPNWTIVYTFSGNASQQLPLTSAEFSGALSSLVGVVGGGLAIASGGGLGVLGGATGIAHAVTHEMVHLAHSGSLSANAGIMGARTPYLILTRRHSYDANGYNEIYGYPSNKTVFLNNCSGYVKVKDILLETSATDSERLEIENLLKAGVII